MNPQKNIDWLAGFKACLDLIKHHIIEISSVKEIINIIQSIEAAVIEKQVVQIRQELFLP